MARNQSYDEWRNQYLAGETKSPEECAKLKQAAAQREAARRQAIKNTHQAHVIAFKKHKAYGHLPQREKMSLADALKTIQSKIQAA